jgi:hypothetical protein
LRRSGFGTDHRDHIFDRIRLRELHRCTASSVERPAAPSKGVQVEGRQELSSTSQPAIQRPPAGSHPYPKSTTWSDAYSEATANERLAGDRSEPLHLAVHD